MLRCFSNFPPHSFFALVDWFRFVLFLFRFFVLFVSNFLASDMTDDTYFLLVLISPHCGCGFDLECLELLKQVGDCDGVNEEVRINNAPTISWLAIASFLHHFLRSRSRRLSVFIQFIQLVFGITEVFRFWTAFILERKWRTNDDHVPGKDKRRSPRTKILICRNQEMSKCPPYVSFRDVDQRAKNFFSVTYLTQKLPHWDLEDVVLARLLQYW